MSFRVATLIALVPHEIRPGVKTDNLFVRELCAYFKNCAIKYSKSHFTIFHFFATCETCNRSIQARMILPGTRVPNVTRACFLRTR